MKTLLILTLFPLLASADDYPFCQKQNSVISFGGAIYKAVVESQNYELKISENKQNAYLIYSPSKKKDKYTPRVEILTDSGQKILLIESDCKYFKIIDLSAKL